MPLASCGVGIVLTMSEDCVITSRATREANPDANPVVLGINNPTFKITHTKLYAPVVTLSAENDNKLLDQLKQDLKEQPNGISIDQKCLIRLKTTI